MQYHDTLLHSNFTSHYRLHCKTFQALGFNIKHTIVSKNSEGCSKWKVVDSSGTRPFLQTTLTLANIHRYQFNNPTLFCTLCLLALVCWETTNISSTSLHYTVPCICWRWCAWRRPISVQQAYIILYLVFAGVGVL